MQIAPGTSVTTNVTADQVFNIGSCAVSGTADVFSMINNIEQAVTNGDTTTLSSSLSDVDANLANVTTLETQVGATASRVTSAETSLASTKTSLSSLLSQTTDADYTQAVIDLQTEENVYQAATSTASSVLKLSLVNFFS
jgi:flagellar hook-associated protein 3 FlgL